MLIPSLSVSIAGNSIKLFLHVLVPFPSPFKKAGSLRLHHRVCYVSHFALESSVNLFSLSKRSPLPSVPPACLGTLIVSASPSVRFLRPGSWKRPRVPARGSVPVYTWSSVLLDVKSLARCFPRVVLGTACGRPSAIISVSFPYKSWALSAEMPENLSFKSSLFL